MRSIILIIAACLIAAAAGYGFYRYAHQGAQAAAASEPLPPGIKLNGLDGTPQAFDQWHGKLLLVNFWATWCSPCLHEIPDLVRLQKQYGARGLQIVGPAVDDVDSVRSMLGPLAIDYPVLTETPDAMIDLMAKLGNGPGGLPFSLLISPDGRIIRRQLGEFGSGELEGLIQKHLPVAAS